ncbi:MAG: hypothetical protein K1X79_01090 [Oligoflexia bacterium]|nr:hypothetical protein [Oligoflexia bacterium]
MLIDSTFNQGLSQLGLQNGGIVSNPKQPPLAMPAPLTMLPNSNGIADFFAGRPQERVSLTARQLATLISDAISRTVQTLVSTIMEKMGALIQSLRGSGPVGDTNGTAGTGQVGYQEPATTDETQVGEETSGVDDGSATTEDTKDTQGSVLDQVKEVFSQIKDAFLDPKSGVLATITGALGTLIGGKGVKSLTKVIKGAVKMFKKIIKDPSALLKTGKKLWNKAKKLFGKLF